MKRVLSIISFVLFFSLSLFAKGSKEQQITNINVSYVDSPFNLQVMVMKDRGLLEKAFEEKGISVTWHTITSGAEQTQAMAAGSLDIASVVNTASVILANAAGNRVEVAGIVSRPTRTFAVLVGPDGPQSIADLKGKTVAGPKGTVLHQTLAAGLSSVGLSLNDVNFISMALPDARTALLSGNVDAALQAASLIIKGKEAGFKVLFSADGYLTPLLVTAVRPAFASEHPELLDIYLQVQKDTYDWITAHPQEAVAIGAEAQGVSVADGADLYAWSGMARILEPNDVAAMEADVQFLLEQEMIENSVVPADFVLPVAFR